MPSVCNDSNISLASSCISYPSYITVAFLPCNCNSSVIMWNLLSYLLAHQLRLRPEDDWSRTFIDVLLSRSVQCGALWCRVRSNNHSSCSSLDLEALDDIFWCTLAVCPCSCTALYLSTVYSWLFYKSSPLPSDLLLLLTFRPNTVHFILLRDRYRSNFLLFRLSMGVCCHHKSGFSVCTVGGVQCFYPKVLLAFTSMTVTNTMH